METVKTIPDGELVKFLGTEITLEEFVQALQRLLPDYGHCKVGVMYETCSFREPPRVEAQALHPDWVFIGHL